MARKNFDAFINSAGKKPKLTPEEVEAMAKQLHQPAAVQHVAKVAEVPVQPPAKPTPAMQKEVTVARSAKSGRNAEPVEPPKEKVRITIDLAKDLYKRMKLAVVQNETEISAYVRMLIETDLAKR